MKRLITTPISAVCLLTLPLLTATSVAWAGETEWVDRGYDAASLGIGGGRGYLAVSDDGRYVMHASSSSLLVENDTNGQRDIFLYDRINNTTERVNVNSQGQQADLGADGIYFDVSANGSVVVFSSRSNNLVPEDNNNTGDVFARDLSTGTTERVSVTTDGLDQSNVTYLRTDRTTTTFKISDGLETVSVNEQSYDMYTGGYAWQSSVSADGRFVTFTSGSSNLVLGDTNNADDIFVYDRQLGTTERVSVSSSGEQTGLANTKSGERVTTGVYSDGRTWTRTEITYTEQPAINRNPQISGDGRFVVFSSTANSLVEGDTNETWSYYVRDRDPDGNGLYEGNGNTTRIPVVGFVSNYHKDNFRNISFSSNGRYFAYNSIISEGTDHTVYVYDLVNGTTEIMTENTIDGLDHNGIIRDIKISGDGRYVAYFALSNSNLLADSTPDRFMDILITDRNTGTHKRLGVYSTDCGQYDYYPYHLNISHDGQIVTFDAGYYSQPALAEDVPIPHGGLKYVHDRNGSHRCEVSNQVPVADAGSDQTVVASVGNTYVTLNGSASSDPDGDSLNYSWSWASGSATGVSPSIVLGVGSHEITLTVDDGNGGIASDTVVVNVVYGFGEFMPPLKVGGVYKLGRTLPVKFQMFYADGSLVTDANPRLTLQKLSNGVPSEDPVIVPESTSGADSGNIFRLSGDHYIYNLATDYLSKGTYRLAVDLGDGSVPKIIDIAFK